MLLLLMMKHSIKGAIKLATTLKLHALGERFDGILEERLLNKFKGTMPVFDTLCTLFPLENGCTSVLTMVLWSVSPKLICRVDGMKGTLQIELNSDIGWHGFLVSFY